LLNSHFDKIYVNFVSLDRNFVFKINIVVFCFVENKIQDGERMSFQCHIELGMAKTNDKWGGPCGSARGPLRKMRGGLPIPTR